MSKPTPPTRPIETVSDTARAVFIFANPFSGSGPNRKWVDGLEVALREAELEPRVVWDRDERRAVLGDPTLSETCRCVVSAGGDGSLADVVNELAADVPVATLPMGNENLFAAHLGFDRRGVRLAEAIARGQVRRIDLGAIERAGESPRLFTLMAGIGFDGEVVHRLARWRSEPAAEDGTLGARARNRLRFGSGATGGLPASAARENTGGQAASGTGLTPGLRRVNRISYIPRIVGALREYPYAPLTLEADGQRVAGVHAFVFNLPCYGMDLGLAPDARGDSGLLHWVVFERPGMVHLARYGIRALLKRHYLARDVHHGSAARVTLDAQTSVPVQADGDPTGTTPLTFSVRPAALRVIAM